MKPVFRVILAVLVALVLLVPYWGYLFLRWFSRLGWFRDLRLGLSLHWREPLKIRITYAILHFDKTPYGLLYRIHIDAKVQARQPIRTARVALEWRLSGVHLSGSRARALCLYDKGEDQRGIYLFDGESRQKFLFESYFKGWRGMTETVAQWQRARLIIGKSKSGWVKVVRE